MEKRQSTELSAMLQCGNMLNQELGTVFLLSLGFVCFSFYGIAYYLYLSHRISGAATTITSFLAWAIPVFLLTGLALPSDANLTPLRMIVSMLAGLMAVGKLWRSIKFCRRNAQVAQWPYTTHDEVSSKTWQLINLAGGFVLGGVIGASIMWSMHSQSNYLVWGALFGAEMAALNAGLLNVLVRVLPRR